MTDDVQQIEQDFKESWEGIEEFYMMLLDKGWEKASSLRNIVQTLRENGYDKNFRAGTSMATFILSRSRRHGLRARQASLSFETTRYGLKVTYNKFPHSTIMQCRTIAYREEFDELLERLLQEPID